MLATLSLAATWLVGSASKHFQDAACDVAWRDFDDLFESLAYWDRDAAKYLEGTGYSQEGCKGRNCTGIRLGGSFQLFYNPTDAASHIGSADGRLRVGECTLDVEAGTWHTQRIGPFRSVGGSDYLSLFHRDFATVKETLERVGAGQRIGITAHAAGPMDEDCDQLLPLPPIHYHHMFIEPGNYEVPLDPNVEALWPGSTISCWLHGERCPISGSFLTYTGDYQCLPEGGGTECFGHDYGPKYIKLFNEQLSIFWVLQDVRPVGSKPLTWWYQTALRTTIVDEASERLPLSLMIAQNPAPDVLDDFDTVDVPSNTDSLVYYTGRMPWGGSLVAFHWHAHQLKFQSALFVAASPHALGLGLAVFRPQRPWLPIISADTGFDNNTALRKHMLHQLVSTTGSLDALICDVYGSTEVVDGMRVDRAVQTSCGSWTFSAGDQWTIAALCGPVEGYRWHVGDSVGGPEFAGMSGAVDESTFPIHLIPLVYYAADDRASHYTVQIYSHTIDAVDIANSRLDVLRATLLGGTADAPPTLTEHLACEMIIFLLYWVDVATHFPLGFLGCIPLSILGCLPYAFFGAVVLALGVGFWCLACSAPHLISCRVLPLAIITALYITALVTNTFLIADKWVILTPRGDTPPPALSFNPSAMMTKALLIALAAALMVATTQCARMASASRRLKDGGEQPALL